MAPINKITGVGYENFKRSQTSEIRKSGSSGLITLINFATFFQNNYKDRNFFLFLKETN